MKGKVTLVFFLTITTLSICYAIPVAQENENSIQIDPEEAWPYDSTDRNRIVTRCLIPCDKSGNDTICGTDGRNYTSPKELICYQMCGRDIQVAYKGKCKASLSTTSLAPEN